MKLPYADLANRCFIVDSRARNWEFPKQYYGKDAGSGKTNEWVFKFVRNDGLACRTDIKEFYFLKDRVTHILVRQKLNFLAPYDAQFLKDGYPVRTHIIFGQRIEKDARLIECFPNAERKGIFYKLVSKVT